jgi:Uma2 family endonuclease
MEALALKTVQDLLLSSDERVELIGGEIVQRPMPRARHGKAQSRVDRALGPFDEGSGPGGWFIFTEISVAYEVHECPIHDLAGWRRERLPELPDGPIEVPPDWVCEIVSPGHEKKDTLTIPLLLRRHRVTHYWVIWPEDRALIAYVLDNGEWRVVATLKDRDRARLPPFEAVELDLGLVLGLE